MNQASEVVAEAIASTPGLTSKFVEECEHFRDRAVTEALMDSLIRAGLSGAR